jgi:DNA-binding NarL/FixJ family response regulator
MKILLVDDEECVLAATALYLRLSEKMEVTKAWGGQEALKAYEAEGPFDVVLTDYSMPGMNGVDLCHALRKLNPTQKIVINTMSDNLSTYMEDFGLADVPVVSKRYGIEEIVKVVKAQ